MKKAWEIERELTMKAIPRILSPEEQTWETAFDAEKFEEDRVQQLWWSLVPGSGAPEHLIIAAIQSVYNMGYDTSEAEKIIPRGLKALELKDKIEISKCASLIYMYLNQAPPIPSHPSFGFRQYSTFSEIESQQSFPISHSWVSNDFPLLQQRIYSGWLGQIIGGAL